MLRSESRPPSLIRCIRKLRDAFEKTRTDYMFVGGLALPAYGEIRATQDVDIAVSITSPEELETLIRELERKAFKPTAEPDVKAACIYLFDEENAVDVELWLKPDGVIFDKELLRRRRQVKLDENLKIKIIGPEDFIVNKLSRTDRRARDESDVVSVLIGYKEKLDRAYLERRAEEFDVLHLLKALERKIKEL